MMEKVVVAVSLNAIFTARNSLNQRISGRTDDIFLSHDEEKVFGRGPLLAFIKRLLQCKKQNTLPFVEVVIISDVSPNLSPCIFESLNYFQVEVDDVILTTRESIGRYLKILEVDLYFSANLQQVRLAQRLNIFSGLVSLEHPSDSFFRLAIDHRLFAQEGMFDSIGKVLPVLAIFQKNISSFKVSLLTTRSYSVESWVKELFYLSQCKINEVCFLGSGSTLDVCRIFDFTIYVEGEKRDSFPNRKPLPCVLNVDF